MCQVGHSVQGAHGKCRFFSHSAFTESYNKAMQQGIRIRERSHEGWTSYPRLPSFTADLEEDEERQNVARSQVWSSHSARFGALHVCISTASSQSLHSTAQHHLNLHSHLVIRFTRVVSQPRPQHITSQPSVPRDDLLQTRPAVPKEP